MNGETASVIAAGKSTYVERSVPAAAAAFPIRAATGPAQRRAILNSCADAPDARSGEFVALGAGVTGGTGPWFGFNVLLFANMLCEAAAMTIQIKGETIPAEEPGSLATGDRQPVGVLVGMARLNVPTSLE